MSTQKIDMNNMSEKVKFIIDDFKDNKFLELEEYLDNLVKTENKYITDSEVENIKTNIDSIIKNATLINSVDVYSVFEVDSQTRGSISEFVVKVIHQNNKNHNRLRRICQNIIGYSETKCKGLLLIKKLNANNFNDIFSIVYEIGKLNAEINNLDLERLGERNKSKSGGDAKAKASEKFYLAVNNFLEEKKFYFYGQDKKRSYKEMFDFLIINIESLNVYLNKRSPRYLVKIVGSEDLSFTINQKRNYFVPNPKNDQKYTAKLSKFFND